MTVFQAKTFQTVGSNGFSNAKKLADLAIKRNIDSKQTGYEQAIKILSQYQYSNNESDALDAQRLVQGYTNTFDKLKSNSSEVNQTVSQFKISEREAFYITPTTQYRSNTMFDIPTVVSDTTAELQQLSFEVSSAIEKKKRNGESAAQLENYYNGLSNRYRMMQQLNNDLLNNDISQKQALHGYGVFVSADQNTGQVYGISVAPVGDLPQGMSQSSYKRIDSSVNYGGGNIAVYSKFSTDNNGLLNARIGNRVWSGDAKFPLSFDGQQSIDKNYKSVPGNLNFNNFAQKESTPIQPGKFFKGYTGFDSNGNPKQTMFFVSKDSKIYTVDKNSQNLLSKDFGNKMNNAIGVDSNFAKNVLNDGSVKPIDVNPMIPSDSLSRVLFPNQLKPVNQQSPFFSNPNQLNSSDNLTQSFFNKNNNIPQIPSNPTKSFIDNKNSPNKPDQASGMSLSTPDIINNGKAFFRDASKTTNPPIK